MTKVDIISGFLGAGKTTLIRELLTEALKDEQVVLIENEFGEIGIDGGFLREAGVQIREMNSGCICCSLVGDFGKALGEVTRTYHPDRIIIEPSGVGKLTDVIRAVERVSGEAGVEVHSATTVVDVLKCRMYLKNFGEFFKNQVEACGTVILSRTDTEKADPEKIGEAVRLLRDLNASATIVTTPAEELGGRKLLSIMEGAKPDLLSMSDDEADHDGCEEHHDEDEHACGCGDHHDEDEHACGCGHHHEDHDHIGGGHHDEHGHHHHHHDADEVFTSWGRETARPYAEEELRRILKALTETEEYGTVLRAKGIVPKGDGSWLYFDMVPGEADVRPGAPEYTGRICVIGSKLKEEKLAKLFGTD